MRQLVGAGFLTHDVGGYGGLSLGPKARTLLNGGGEFRYRKGELRGTKKAARAEVIAKLSETDPRAGALLVRLKALRMQLARQARVPAYVIFSDRTLIDMAARVPLTKWDFGEVHGVGAAKQENSRRFSCRDYRFCARDCRRQSMSNRRPCREDHGAPSRVRPDGISVGPARPQ